MAGIDMDTADSPGWWLRRLHTRLVARQGQLERLRRYWEGDHDLPEGDQRCREMFQKFQRKARTNYTGMLVEAVAERLKIEGFRSGAKGSDDLDSEAWRIHQANSLDADSYLVHSTALALRDAYVIVGSNDDDPKTPLITPEDPRQVIAEFDPVRRREPRAALKTWIDDAKRKRFAVLYLPDSIHYFSAEAPDMSLITDATSRWQLELASTGIAWTIDEEDEAAENPLGEVPVVRFAHRPRMNGEGRSILEFGAVDIQDRINDTVLNRLVIQKMQAYRQRWVKGIKTEDENGDELALPFVPGVDLLWSVEETEVEFGEFDTTDIKQLLDAVKEDVTAFVITTALPPQYVAGNIVNAAADAIAAVTDRFNTNVQMEQLNFGESWEQVYRLAAKTAGESLPVDIEVLWTDPERASLAQRADAATKYRTAGVPFRPTMRVLGFSPQEIDRMDSDRMNDAMLGMFAAPTTSSSTAPMKPAEAPVPAATGSPGEGG